MEKEKQLINKAMTIEQRNIIYKLVKNYAIKNYSTTCLINLTDSEDLEHVIQTGVSILATKWGLEEFPGSFVKSVVSNDLINTFASADDVNEKVIKFYVLLMYNTGKPIEFN